VGAAAEVAVAAVVAVVAVAGVAVAHLERAPEEEPWLVDEVPNRVQASVEVAVVFVVVVAVVVVAESKGSVAAHIGVAVETPLPWE